MKKNIAVVVGGFSPEAIISMKSGEQVAKNLDRNLFEVYMVNISKDGWVVKGDLVCDVPVNKVDFSFSFNNRKIKFDFAFILIHGHPGENFSMPMARLKRRFMPLLPAVITVQR